MGGKVSVKILSSFLLVGFPGGAPRFPRIPLHEKKPIVSFNSKNIFHKSATNRPTNQPTTFFNNEKL